MSVTALSPEASPSDDKLVREWKAVRSRLHEAEHRLNSRYAQRKYDGESIDPQEVLRYLAKTYDRAAAMAVKTVTDHDAALGCLKELNIYSRKLLKLSSRLFREVLPREGPHTVQGLTSELRRRLLSRSEHWKAEAHKVARLAERAGARVRNQPAVTLGGSSKEERKPVARQILCTAMDRLCLGAPKLAAKIRAILKRKGETKLKVDRSTVYRIVERSTKHPNAAIRASLMEALQLEGEDAEIVRRELGGSGNPPTSTNSRKN